MTRLPPRPIHHPDLTKTTYFTMPARKMCRTTRGRAPGTTGADSVVIPAGEPLPLGVKTRRRKTHVFRIVLSHSRKAYSEAV